MTASDPEMFNLVINSLNQVEFELELTWTCAGRTGSTAIKKLGFMPFTHP